MKNIINKTVYIILLACFFSSCSDSVLKEVPKTFYAPENLYINTAGFDVALDAIYTLVRGELSGYRREPAMYTGTDLSWSIFSHADVVGFQSYGGALTPNLPIFSDWWNPNYQGISWANLIIEKAEDPSVKWNTTADKARILGEARFFRGYFHNQLTVLFGDVPISDKYYSEPKLDFVRNPKKDVLEFVKKDLIYAVENLPADPSKLVRGKLTQWAAKQMLTEVYLETTEYLLSTNMAKDIISNSPFKLMTSRFGPDASNPKGNVFHDLFLENNSDFNDGNKESIWTIEQKYNTDGGDQSNWMRRCHVCYYQRVPGLQLADSLGGRGVGYINTTQAYLDLYETQDMRNANNNIRRKWYYNYEGNLPAGKKIGELVVLDPNDPLYIQHRDIDMYACTTKWDFGAIGRGGGSTFVTSPKDYAKMRLAETYLLLAEGQMLSGDNASAAATLNTLRARSNASAITSAQVNMDFILDERGRELYAEEYRRYTLFRTGMFLKRVRAMNPQVANTVTDRDKLFPIPQSVIDLNTQAVMTQNPGY